MSNQGNQKVTAIEPGARIGPAVQIAMARGIKVSATIMGGFALGETLRPSDKVRVAREGKYGAESVFCEGWTSLSQSSPVQARYFDLCRVYVAELLLQAT